MMSIEDTVLNIVSPYVASPIKRTRATARELEARNDAILSIVSEMQPMTVRQVFYQATVRGVVEKTEAGYGKVQRALVELRRSGALPWGYIADNTRWQRKPRSWRDPTEALRSTAQFYRKALWTYAESYVEVWLEKDALSAVIYDVTESFDVPLMVARGYASLSFLHNAAEDIQRYDRPTYIYHLGDFDPSGVDAANKIERSLREFAPHSEIIFERLALNREQISEWSLPTRPTKATDSRAKSFGNVSVELDAVAPGQLRQLVQQAIERHLPQRQLEMMKVAEESERNLIESWAANLGEAYP